MIKILLLMEKGEPNGASWYRYTQFAKKANELGIADVQYIDLSLSEEDLTKVLEKADVYFARVSSPALDIVFEQKDRKLVVIDMDDGLDDIDPLSEHYSGLGTKEIVLKDGTYLWKDHVGGFNAWRNRMRVDSYKERLGKADALICTTLELRNYLEQFNKVVAVIPNAIDFDIFPKVKDPKKGKEIRLGWSGGSSHFSDLQEVRESLMELMRVNPNLHFYIYGVPFKGVIKDMPQDRVHTGGWVSPQAHGYRLACSDWDIGICPIRDTGFNRLKSSIKYYELSALGVCGVCRNIPPYSDDIVDGENGILYNTPQEFTEKVQKLIDDPILRLRVAESAYSYTKEHRTLENITGEWVGFLEGVATATKK